MISAPIRWYGQTKVELELMWFTPFCKSCESDGRMCGLKGDDGETTCFGLARGIKRSVKHGLITGSGVSILICIIALVWYTCIKAMNFNQIRHQNTDVFSISISRRPRSSPGLDLTTIESYTKTVLGASRRLPTDHETCPICLCDYKPKEALRTIPECNHYFHVDCIDEWLRLNGTCPMCRSLPEKFICGYGLSL